MTLIVLHEFPYSSVDGAPAQCSGGHGVHSCRGLGFFFVPRSCHVYQNTFYNTVNITFSFFT